MESFTTAGAERAASTDQQRPHVVLLASPGAGHLIPLAELARRLVEHHGFAATLVTFTDLISSPEALSGVPACVSTAALPPVPLQDLPAATPMETALFELVRRSLPHLRTLLRSVAQLAALVPDFFCSAALPLAGELGVPAYVFVPSNLTALALMRRTVELHDGVPPGEHRDLPDPLELPGGVLLRRADLPRAFRSSNEPVYAHHLEEGRRYRQANGFLVNTFYEMEPATVEDFRQAAAEGAWPPVFPVGPFVRSGSDETGDSACLEWLDRQPTGSVVYVSFGSGGSLSVEQTAELAAGLEASGYRFLWVVRMPSMDGHEDEEEHGRCKNGNPLAWLPEGFLERTKDKGLAVAAWAPQVRVLSHPATAAFVSHCGWNSTMESVSCGVPMIAWPLYAEQRMNAVVLEGSVGMALRVRPRARDAGGDGVVVSRRKIADAVRELMEGQEKGRAVRRQAGDMQQAAAHAWAPEGSSRRTLEEVAATWKAWRACRGEAVTDVSASGKP
jgi:hydroquinone glucosyltransferase